MWSVVPDALSIGERAGKVTNILLNKGANFLDIANVLELTFEDHQRIRIL